MRTNRRLKRVTGKWLKDSHRWLVEQGCGCCHIIFGTTANCNVCVCVGWHDDGTEDGMIAWKIGWQTFDNAMQSDFDVDFDMPWCTKAYCERKNAELKAQGLPNKYRRYAEGDLYDTLETIELREGRTTPRGYRDWNALASFVRRTARRVLAFAKEVDPEEGDE